MTRARMASSAAVKFALGDGMSSHIRSVPFGLGRPDRSQPSEMTRSAWAMSSAVTLRGALVGIASPCRCRCEATAGATAASGFVPAEGVHEDVQPSLLGELPEVCGREHALGGSMRTHEENVPSRGRCWFALNGASLQSKRLLP